MDMIVLALVGVVASAALSGAVWARQRRLTKQLQAEGADLPKGIGRCPVCEDEALVAQPTAGERGCPVCGGRLLAPDRARDLVFMPRGLTPGALKAVGTGRGVAQGCAACGGAMRPVLIDDDVIDVCLHCGAVWCDADELQRLLRSDAFAR